MAALNFTPDSPSNGDTFTANGVTYTYDGTKWKTTINSNAFLPLSGGTLSGNLNMGTNDLTVGDVTASGTASLSGLTYPTSDGTPSQFLQTNGSGTLSFATVTDTTGWTWDTTGTAMTGTTVTISGIPSTATIIKFVIKDYSQSTTGGALRIRLSTSSGPQTSTYETIDAIYGGATAGSTRTDGWYLNCYSTTGTFDAEGEFVYATGNSWWGQTINKRTVAAANYHFNSIGIGDINDTVTGISFYQDAGTMGGGTIFVHYFEP